jgi:hypothetical protein
MIPTAPTSHGYRGFAWPSPALAWANFVDPRFGLFAYCPVLLLAFGAPFASRVRYPVPAPESRVLWIYFLLFALFCAANRYSWLQPSTGFRYLVPVVPALVLLSAQTAQMLPRVVRRALTGLAFAQSLIVAAAHENDIRESLISLWRRHFELFWMVRVRDAGAPVTWVWEAMAYAAAAAALAAIWVRYRQLSPAGGGT